MVNLLLQIFQVSNTSEGIFQKDNTEKLYEPLLGINECKNRTVTKQCSNGVGISHGHLRQ